MLACQKQSVSKMHLTCAFAKAGATYHLNDQSVDVCKRASWEGRSTASAAAGIALSRAVRGDDRGSVAGCGTGRSGRAVEGYGAAIYGKIEVSAGARDSSDPGS